MGLGSYEQEVIKAIANNDIREARKWAMLELGADKTQNRLQRYVCTYNIALRYGMIQENREQIKFYFEKEGASNE